MEKQQNTTSTADSYSEENTLNSNIPKDLRLKEDATISHPLMYSPVFPDLIPEKAKSKYKDTKFKPPAHSSPLENNIVVSVDSLERQLNMPILEYNEKLPEFPRSPSDLKKLLMYELPVEASHDPPSDTENDKSIYEAHLSSNLQNVSLTMNEKEGNLNFLSHNARSNKLRRIKVPETQQSDDSDLSSLDSNSGEESLKSDILDEREARTKVETDEDNNTSEPIEPLSAAEERRHARNWQRMILPGGEHRTIDMRVIEPYKRVLSHGGYLRAGGHTAIVLFASCHLPDKSRIDYDYVMDNLFLYVLWTLERLVTDDYVLVYLHGASTKLPSFSWLKRCYQMVGRRLRKNLSHLYIVHPTLWIKTILYMSKPFISSKFYRKVSFIANLRELLARVPLEAAAIPEKVRAYDSLHCTS
ncbi:protein prune homolog 2 [Cylas formicarius]|uniref:protein prune homolog 2 n=1 Tax=Cylas formicarius TaxID=197179 RepID=UPI002958971A|nr:protein prune homolog 2 [Cylas formicarius]